MAEISVPSGPCTPWPRADAPVQISTGQMPTGQIPALRAPDSPTAGSRRVTGCRTNGGSCDRPTSSRLATVEIMARPSQLWRFTPHFWQLNRQSSDSGSVTRPMRYDLDTTNRLLAGFVRQPPTNTIVRPRGSALLPRRRGVPRDRATFRVANRTHVRRVLVPGRARAMGPAMLDVSHRHPRLARG
jgi:hypothetical protein